MDMSSILQNLAPGLPKPGAFPTAAEVRKDARRYATKLFKDCATLRNIVERHEETVRARWSKKSYQQRKKLLLQAWPNMSAHHRPDVEAWRQHSKKKEAYLWPYINLEDLTKPKTMLLLLHFRGRHPPSEFVHSDLEHAALGEASGTTMPAFLNEYTMLFHGRDSADKYGELVSWDDDEDAFENMYNGIGMHPGHGLQALEIQQRIWEFLVKWCQGLLQDMTSLDEANALPNPGPPSSLSDITSLQITALEAPYRIPAHLDMSRLEAIAFAERNAREDHLWALREDPSYFADAMQEAATHRQEMLLDTNRQVHPTLKEPGKPLFWNRVLGNLSMEAHFGFASFDEIVRQINGLSRLLQQYKDQIKPENTLPPELVKAFQGLRFLLDAEKLDLINALKVGLFPSPSFRPFCYREPQDPRTSKIRAAYKPPQQDHPVKRIMPFFEILFDEKQLRLFGLHTVTDEIGHLMQSDAEIRNLISPWIANKLSSLSVVSECLHQLHLFQPWSRKIEDDMESMGDKLRSNYAKTFEGWFPFTKVKFEGSQLYRYADPTDGKFNYPIQRRRNKQNVAILRTAEANLDALWEAVDEYYKARIAGSSQHDLVAQLLSSDRAIQRTPEWSEPPETEKKVEQDEYVYQPFSVVFHDHTKQVTGAFTRASLSDKTPKQKTRGAAVPPTEPQHPAVPHEPPSPTPTISVDKRAYKVFRALFHSPNNPDTPGEIPWLDFLHALVSVGFSAEKLHGSAWNFTPRSFDAGLERSIQFHEPHPSNKLPFWCARRYGRRLAKAYGWSGNMFRLA